MTAPARLVVGISGASGVILGVRLLETLRRLSVESHLVLSRAAEVALKEFRPLVLMVRETPLHLGHLRTMTQLAEMGAIIAPPVPAFHTKPRSLDDLIDHAVGRVLDLIGLDTGTVRRWGEPMPTETAGRWRPGPKTLGNLDASH